MKVNILLIGVLIIATPADTSDLYRVDRQQMVDTIIYEVAETASYTGREVLAAKVIRALLTVPRHEFVPFLMRQQAYINSPLPIGHNQTISQPYIVAIMTELIDPQPEHKVLEIGTGSGYQAAILSRLVNQVYTIEIIAELAIAAKKTLARLEYNNVYVRAGDGYLGWPEQAPFDSIIVTAGGEIPEQLLMQLKPGGTMIIPVGGFYETQYLTLITKDDEGKIFKRKILPVRFVPLINSRQQD
ncbi:protein-L-isoaspartate(D-aspartate) O-methyltransferase [Thalassomonas actiniarum]|uniref:Protein-L-isoaspartate O-methyltransferase n=1 Tax=Thalassomonas actiniarum TaxID=485447 RepID=A0AAE9YVL3_9GAMM|nr:protein-L-isoaspartate(D-aspartate) O-methyltransferase [Thalassomonas actiniarum]WDE02066.1 protein-L-isoaspartate(D-aspartate) O-methyltransferase [Thalassomonas actiniarum]